MNSTFNRRKAGFAILLCALVAVLVIGGLLLIRHWEQEESRSAVEALTQQSGTRAGETAEAAVRYQGKWYRQNPDLETVLLIGLDKYEKDIPNEDNYENAQQSDFLALLLINRADNNYTILHLNRDTMAEVPQLSVTGEQYDTRVEQLALAHTYGSGGKDSCRNTVQAVSNLLYGVEIDHYVSVTMDAVPILNDLLGGVTVHIGDDFSAVDAALVQGEDVTLQGEQALTFVRSRGSMEDSSNLARMVRQRTYLKAMKDQAVTCLNADSGFAARAMLELADYMVSDCTVNQLSGLLDTAITFDSPEILTTAGEAVKGEKYMEFYVDEAALQQQVIDLFFVEEQQ